MAMILDTPQYIGFSQDPRHNKDKNFIWACFTTKVKVRKKGSVVVGSGQDPRHVYKKGVRGSIYSPTMCTNRPLMLRWTIMAHVPLMWITQDIPLCF